MRAGLARAARGLVVAVVVIAWAAIAHYTSALVDESSWGALLAIAPFAAIAAGFAWQSPRRGAMFALLAAGSFALALVWPTLAHNVGWLYFVQHVGTNVLLVIGFGRTLTAGREPMCTRIARAMHDAISPALARYTRQVTVAWTVFFIATAAISCALFAFGTLEAWSTFANLLTMPLVGLMFVAEYLVRLKVVPEDRSSILDAVHAYRRTSSTTGTAPVNER
ncbi:hypothetical protein [Azoarcus sp. DN11]|uniref:COG4648 family protein n=1 Tax=Azoarcus sp. DN11 TaxID=356837 RepID=UPI000EB1A546|nr:hypothetical protein [Azoarcus sp. DN11]AYH44366.1 hypothetical protein CDA09_13370 [Azoarcus sp. DN11]